MEDIRWHVGGRALLQACCCGIRVTESLARRAAPLFRGLRSSAEDLPEGPALAANKEALEYLQLRGHGVFEENGLTTEFVKRHYLCLPECCRTQLLHGAIHPLSFGLHIPYQAD